MDARQPCQATSSRGHEGNDRTRTSGLFLRAVPAVPDGFCWSAPLSLTRTQGASSGAGFANHGLTWSAITAGWPEQSGEPRGNRRDNTIYALDSKTIDLCLSLFPWAPFRSTKAAVKRHTRRNLRGNIPIVLHISDGKAHDVNILNHRIPEVCAFYIFGPAYVDFGCLARFDHAGAFFVSNGMDAPTP